MEAIEVSGESKPTPIDATPKRLRSKTDAATGGHIKKATRADKRLRSKTDAANGGNIKQATRAGKLTGNY
jgi:hypothetical protein